jgi:surfactin synthase thioesterase subunit
LFSEEQFFKEDDRTFANQLCKPQYAQRIVLLEKREIQKLIFPFIENDNIYLDERPREPAYSSTF